MEKIRLGNTDLKVSKIAMGGIPIIRPTKEKALRIIRKVINMGINFIDTARDYADSEEKIGEAIKIFSRQDLVLSSKSTARDKKTFLENVDISLRTLNTDYIDIYHLHAVSTEEDFEKVMSPGGAYDGLVEAILKGKIRYYAFSSHNPGIAEKMLCTEKFQVAQIPLNFIDTEPEKKLIPLAHELNIGFLAMKPLGGGMLEDINLAFLYLSQFKEIIPVIGIEKSEEMEEIINIFKNLNPITEKEIQKIKRIKEMLGDNWCHRCGYCQPCPEGVPITSVLITKSILKRTNYNGAISIYSLKQAIEKARDCIECKKCVEKCPYNLNIPALLKENIKVWENYTKEN